MSKSFNETYVKEKIIYIKKKLHIVANGGDGHFSSGLKTVSGMHVITFQVSNSIFYKATDKRFLIVQRKRRLQLKSTEYSESDHVSHTLLGIFNLSVISSQSILIN